MRQTLCRMQNDGSHGTKMLVGPAAFAVSRADVYTIGVASLDR